jgi:hypothetical protein
VRATRAYLASFGTAGSLLAGAAVAFVLASAFVAFNGWPQVASSSSPASVALTSSRLTGGPGGAARAPAGNTTAQARRLALTLAIASGRPGLIIGGGPGGPGSPTFISIPGIPGGPTGFVSGPQPLGNGNPSSPGCGVCLPPQVAPPLTQVTSAASQAVSSTGSNVSSAVNGVGNAVNNAASNAGPTGRAVGGVARNATSAAGKTVSKAANPVAGLLNGHH